MGDQERAIAFCATWVRRFVARFPGRSQRSLGCTGTVDFLSEMTGRPGVSNWQAGQARDAPELYHEQFCGIALTPRTDRAVAPLASSPLPGRGWNWTRRPH
jgi:hypothetical protein